jgi:hypothetical protein
MSWPDKNNGIGSEPANRLVYWRASKTGRILQILRREVLTGFQPATHNQILNLLEDNVFDRNPLNHAGSRIAPGAGHNSASGP